METKSRRKTKEGMEKREQRRKEGKRKNSRCRFPRSFCLLRFLSRRKMKLLLYQSPFPFPRSLCGRRTNIQASLAPSLVCYLFLSSCLLVHPSLLLLLPTDLFTLANVRTRSRVSRQVRKAENQAHLLLLLHTPPPTARIPKIPSEIADGIFLLLVLSYLSPVGITVPLVPSTDIPLPF